MAQPTPYVRNYGFSAASGAVAPSPIDQNFDLVRVTLDQILNNLELIQRDDEEIANATVGYDQFKPEVQILFTPPTAWVTNTAYTARVDTVFNSNSFYQALTAHTSGASFATDLAAGKWVLIFDFANLVFDTFVNLQQVKTTNFDVSALDQGKTFIFDCNTADGPLVATLPLASAFGEGKRVRFRLRALAKKITGGPTKIRYGYVNCSGSDRFDDDGPQWAISDVEGIGPGPFNRLAEVRVATTANGTLATAFDDASVVDGITLATNDRILLKNQTTGADNGVYVVQAAGAPVRATDADSAAEIGSCYVNVTEGAANAQTTFKCDQASGEITLGVTALTFTSTFNAINSVACATTTNTTISGEQTIDGVLTSSSRVLVKSQTSSDKNGVYVTAAGAWSRATDANTAIELGRCLVYVTGGTVNANKTFYCNHYYINASNVGYGFVNNPITTGAAGSPTTTVSHVNHGRAADDTVILSGLATVDNVTLNGTFTVLPTPTADTYTVTAATNATAGNTNGGGADGVWSYPLSVGTSKLSFAAKQYRLDIRISGDNAALQRQIDLNDWLEVAGITGTNGMTADVNGVRQAGLRAGGQEGGFGGESNVNLARDQVGIVSSTSGATVTKLCLQVPLRTHRSYVEFESDGVSRWYRVNGTMDTWAEGDLLYGRNAFYDAGVQSSNGNRVGWGQHSNYAVPVDFFYDSLTLRLMVRSTFNTEVEDTPEVAMRRARVEPVLEGGISYYPNGTVYIPTQATSSTIYHSTFHNSITFQGRSCTYAHRAAERVLPGASNQGGEQEWFNTILSGTGPSACMWLSSEGKFSVGAKTTTGQFNAAGSADEPQVFAHAKHATYTNTVVKAQATRSGNSAYKLFAGLSNNGSDTEFAVDGVGTVFSDGGTAMTTPADYAEMVREWWDGNADAEDRAGMSVVLVRRDDPEIVIMPENDEHEDSYIRTVRSLPTPPPREAIIGIISMNPAILGASGETRWVKKYVVDAFGRIEMEDFEAVTWEEWRIEVEGKWEDPTTLRSLRKVHYYPLADLPDGVTIPPPADMALDEAAGALEKEKRHRGAFWTSTPQYVTAKRRKLNPDFDPSIPNVPRRERLEWDAVGLLGRLPLLKGEMRGRGWIKTGIVAPDVGEWLVR